MLNENTMFSNFQAWLFTFIGHRIWPSTHYLVKINKYNQSMESIKTALTRNNPIDLVTWLIFAVVCIYHQGLYPLWEKKRIVFITLSVLVFRN